MDEIEFKIPSWLKENYKTSSVPKIKLIRSYTNNVYEVIDEDKKYVLKIYGHNWRTFNEISYEIELLNHLSNKGLPVSEAVAARDGKYVKEFNTPKGQRLAVLYKWAQGKKPEKPFSLKLRFHFGETIGKMHNYSDDFKSSFKRRNIDVKYLIDDPVALSLSYLSKNSLEANKLLEISTKIKNKINANLNKLDYGPVHGDATFDNLHITSDNRIILYDFDSGGPGFRAMDLQGWAVGNEEQTDNYEAFIKGYKSIRKMNNVDVELSPYLTVAEAIWGLEVDLKNRVIQNGNKEIVKYLQGRIKEIDHTANLL